jgi:hypothetical protein
MMINEEESTVTEGFLNSRLAVTLELGKNGGPT